MLSEEKIYEIGTEVFIFKYVPGRRKQYTKHFLRGTIINSEKSNNVALCKEKEYVMNYLVLGEDNKQYCGNMGKHVIGDYYFMTKELYINHINNAKLENEAQKAAIDLDTMYWESIEKAINSTKDNEPKMQMKR